MVLHFLVSADRIVRATYESNGCPSSIACASAAAELLVGRTIDQARKLTGRDLLLLLGGLPEGKGHCADMAVVAVQNAFAGD